MSIRQALQILGVGEGRRAPDRFPPQGAPPPPPAPAPRPSGGWGAPAQTEWERQALAKLGGPAETAAGYQLPPEIRAAMAGGTSEPTFGGVPTLTIHHSASPARPGMMFSQFKPPSGGAVNPQTGEKC